MAVTLGELQRNVRTVPCEYNGLTIQLTYRPAVVSPEATLSNMPIEELLLLALAGWDIYEDERLTTMLPITAETLNGPNIGALLLRAMTQAILRDVMTGKPSGAISDAG